MRALVPLLTAVVLAIAGWLASGIVTVRSLDGPARIGLLPPLSRLLALAVPLVVLAAVDVAQRRRGRPWRAVLVLLPVLLPWLPMPWPAAVLLWTGPLACLWWLAGIAYVHADALTGALRAIAGRPRARAWLGDPRRAPVTAALATGLALGAAAWHTAPQHPRGDEPDYLIITQSILRDGDLRIENNHRQADYAVYHPAVLPPSYLQRGTDGAIYSVHAPGLPVLLAPGFALAGYRGAIATLVIVAMLGAWLAWRASWDVTRSHGASWFGVAATVGAAPYFLHGAAVFPDAPASTLAVFAVWVLVRQGAAPDRGSTTRPVGRGMTAAAALALGLLPWLHTRYAILSVGLGLALAARLIADTAVSRDRTRPAFGTLAGRLAPFLLIAGVCAAAWFGFFVAVYGTPNPSAPYGRYSQMALAHLLPGLPGLLADQQFGLLASAPVLALAAVALRRTIRDAAPHTWRVGVVTMALALAYTAVVGAYRMWWGGLSAPARFLVPLVLPLAPFIAVAWTSLRTRASRQIAVALLAASLAFTSVLVVVDRGALAYNERDGRARWAVWISPLANLVGALPAAHRDRPAVVARDAVVWIGAIGFGWGLARLLERRRRLTATASMASIAVLAPLASAVAWTTSGRAPLAPAASQVRYLERRASSPDDVLMAITPPPVGRTRTWFDVELDSPRSRAGSEYVVLALDHLPAGRYRLRSTVTAPGARLGVTLGAGRAERFIAAFDPRPGADSASFALSLPASDLVVKGSREAADAAGRTWLQADEVRYDARVPPAVRSHAMGDAVWLLPDVGIFPEPGGAWLSGDADLIVGLPSSAPVRLLVRAGAAAVTVTWMGEGGGDVVLQPGEGRTVAVTPSRGRLRWRTRGGFRPSQVDAGQGDQRYLAAWIEAAR